MDGERPRYASICSGIEAASLAFVPLGWQAAWLSEIDPFACALLAHHYPQASNHGDMRALPARILSGEIEAPDVLVGGTPCQAFSVAGLRGSLSDARGNLTLSFCEIADAIDTVRRSRGLPECLILWENVPGVLNTSDNAFGCLLGALVHEDCALEPAGPRWTHAGCVLGPQRAVAWRCLDAQFFGLAQRRERVFLVASARKDIDCAQILFECEGVRRDTAPSTEARQVAPTLPARRTAGGGLGTDFDCDGGLIASCGGVQAFGGSRTSGAIDVSPALTASSSASGRLDFESEAFVLCESRHGLSPTLRAGEHHNRHANADVMPAIAMRHQVRRLTVAECEALQGFPRNYTAIPWRGKPASDCPDGLRYKALGNSWAIPVVAWIGRRMDAHLRANNNTCISVAKTDIMECMNTACIEEVMDVHEITAPDMAQTDVADVVPARAFALDERQLGTGVVRRGERLVICRLSEAQMDAAAVLFRLRKGGPGYIMAHAIFVQGASIGDAASLVGAPYSHAWRAHKRMRRLLDLVQRVAYEGQTEA